MFAPKSWAAFVARVILGLIFLIAGIWKVFTFGAVEHARNLFVEPYADSFLPVWSLWLTGVAVPCVELVCGALMVVGWKRMPAALGLGAVLVLVTFGHLLAEPLYAFNTHVIPRAVLLVVVLAMFDEDAISVDAWLSRRRTARRAGPASRANTTAAAIATAALAAALAAPPTSLAAQSGDAPSTPTADARLLSALELRGIGPALMSGRTASSRSGASCRGIAPRSTGPSSPPRRSCSASRASWARSSGRHRRPQPPSARATRSRRRSTTVLLTAAACDSTFWA